MSDSLQITDPQPSETLVDFDARGSELAALEHRIALYRQQQQVATRHWGKQRQNADRETRSFDREASIVESAPGGTSTGRPPQVRSITWLLLVMVFVAMHFVYRVSVGQPKLAIHSDRLPRPITRSAGSGLEPQQVGTIVEMIQGVPVAPSTVRGGRIVKQQQPEYPDAAISAGAQGDVQAILTINQRGIVDDVLIISGHPVLAHEVSAAASHWRYIPFEDESGAISVSIPVLFRFQTFAEPRAEESILWQARE